MLRSCFERAPVGALMVLCACSGPFTSGEGDVVRNPRDTVVLQPETVLLDEAANMRSLEVETDQLVLDLEDGRTADEFTADAGLQVGSVVVGRLDGGYLREVVEVIPQGSRLVLRTIGADLSQAVVDGKVHAQILLQDELRSETTWDLGGRVLVDETLWSSTQGDYVEVSAFVAEGSHVTLDPVFDFDLELFNGSWVDAEFSSTVTMDYEADVVTTVSGAFDEEISGRVFTREIPFAFELGPVPVVGTATIDIVAGVEGTFIGEGTTTLHSEAYAVGELGAGYDGDWHGHADGDLSGDIGFTDSAWSQDVHARAFLRAEMEVELYSSAGAEVVIEPWVEANSCGTVGLDIDGGVKGSHGYHFEALGWSLFEWGPYPFETDVYDLAELECEV